MMDELERCLLNKQINEEELKEVLSELKLFSSEPLQTLKSDCSEYQNAICRCWESYPVKALHDSSHDELLMLKKRIAKDISKEFTLYYLSKHKIEDSLGENDLLLFIDYFSKIVEDLSETIFLRRRSLLVFHPTHLCVEFKEKKGGKFDLVYFGGFEEKEAWRKGVGIEYKLVGKKIKKLEISFEGEFKMGKKDGHGKEFDHETLKAKGGIWKDNELVEERLTVTLPYVRYSDIKRGLEDSKIIGKGAYGVIYIVPTSKIPYIETKSKHVAVKLVRTSSMMETQKYFDMMRRGVFLSQSVQSKYVIEQFGIVRGTEKNCGVIMEYCEKSVDRLIQQGGISIREKIKYLYEVVCGMVDLHSRFIMHRDLKWGNVLIRFNGECVISDFDSTKIDDHLWRIRRSFDESDRVGTPGFRPPEAILGERFTLKFDVFSFGLMIYSMFFEENFPYASRYQCFCGEKFSRIVRSDSLENHIAKCGFRPLCNRDEMLRYPVEFMELMKSCWDEDPEKRPTFLGILNNGIFEKFGFGKGGDTISPIQNFIVLLRYPKYGLIDDERANLSSSKFKDLLECVERKDYITKVSKLTDAKNGTYIDDDDDVAELLKNRDPVVIVELDTPEAERLEQLLKGVIIEEKEILSVFLRREIELKYLKDFLKKQKNEQELGEVYTEIRKTIEKEYLSRLKNKILNNQKGLIYLVKNRFLKFMEQIDLRYEKLEGEGGLMKLAKEVGKKMINLIPGINFKKEEKKDNYLYFGQVFKRYGELVPHGFGILFLEKHSTFFKNTFNTVFVGEFELNNRHGLGEIYDPKTRRILYRGEFENNLKNGKGVEYTLSKFRENIQCFDGVFKRGVKNGVGIAYDVEESTYTRGRWEMGTLVKCYKFECPLVDFRDFQKSLNEDSRLGFGGYGTVYKVKRSLIRSLKGFEDEEFVAVKRMNMEKFESSYEKTLLNRMMERGIGLRSMVESNHFLKIFAMFSGSRECGCIMEYADGGDVQRLIKKKSIPSSTKIEYLKQIATGMENFHREGVVHRDLKWENVLVKKGVIKITDFDTAKDDETLYKFSASTGTADIGTTGYVAPEIFVGKRRQYTLACDVYAFGMMIYCLLFEEQHPYIVSERKMKIHLKCSCNVQLRRIVEAKNLDYHVANCNLRPLLIPEEVDRHPQFLIDLMVQCWEADPFQRPSFGDILERFKAEERTTVKTRNIVLQFPKHEGVNEQKTFLVEPYEVSVLVKWIESKFRTDKLKTPEIVGIVHSVVGSIYEDSDLEKALEMSDGTEDPVFFVELKEIDEEYAVNEYTRKITYEEYRVLKDKNESYVEELRNSKKMVEALLERIGLVEKDNKFLKKCLRKQEQDILLRRKKDEKEEDMEEEETEGEEGEEEIEHEKPTNKEGMFSELKVKYELLKKDVEMLKKENDALRRKNDSKKEKKNETQLEAETPKMKEKVEKTYLKEELASSTMYISSLRKRLEKMKGKKSNGEIV